MGHWFDRLAAWSAGDDEVEAGESRLTRRQAVQSVAGVGAAGLLAGPLAGKADAIFGGDSAQCRCWDKAKRINAAAESGIIRTFGPASFMSPAAGIIGIFALVSTNAAFLGHIVHCGLCRDDPPLEPPPPKLTPCTQRGGVRLRGDQCPPEPGGGGGAETGTGGCAAGTSSCPTPGGGDLCCFGTDLCCGGGCCCIAEVGCSCCG